MKHRAIIWAERQINRLTRLANLHILLLPASALHSEEVSFRADGLITSHTANFLSDARFLDVVESARKETSHPLYNLFRIYMQMKTAEAARLIPDSIFVECGVGEGLCQLMLNRYFPSLPQTYAIDTFSGIDPRYLEERELRGQTPEARSAEALKSYPRSDFESVRKRFLPYPNVRPIKGAVPDVLEANRDLFESKRVSWLHIDMNNAFPEYCALKFFYPLMTTPGFILFDDYAFKGLLPQKEAVDKACRELGIAQPISLPTGQGLIVKSA